MMANGETMELSTKRFAYDVSDLRALNRQVIRWWALLPLIAIYGFLFWLFGSIMIEDGFSWILAGLLIFVTIAASGPWTWRPLVEHWSLRRQNLLEPMRIGITSDCLVLNADRADARIRW